jgi:hypothetical protein
METNAPAPVQGTVPLSTSLDTTVIPGPAGNGTAPTAAKPESVGDTLRSELARTREEEAKAAKPEDDKAKADDKGEKPEKEVEAKDGKEPKADEKTDKVAKPVKDEEPAEKAEKGAAEKPATERSGAPEERQSEGRKHSEPPARFLPEARAKWANVPNEVKAEFHRVSQEHETEITQYRDSHENWQKLAKFDQMAKQHNTDVSGALERYTAVDGLLQSNWPEGVRQVLATVGITPEQYAQHVMKNPQAHAQQQVAQPPAQQQQSPEIASLKAQIEELRTERQAEKVTPLIQAFASGRDDFKALWPQMEKIILSKVIDQIYGDGLSPEQKLAEAYRMAGGSSPSRSEPQAPVQHSAPANDRPVDPAGQKSIRGAPNGGQEPDDDVPETDIKALLRKEMRKAV